MILHLYGLLAAQLDEMTDATNAARRSGMDQRQPRESGCLLRRRHSDGGPDVVLQHFSGAIA